MKKNKHIRGLVSAIVARDSDTYLVYIPGQIPGHMPGHISIACPPGTQHGIYMESLSYGGIYVNSTSGAQRVTVLFLQWCPHGDSAMSFKHLSHYHILCWSPKRLHDENTYISLDHLVYCIICLEKYSIDNFNDVIPYHD